jgi:hypothetical protein
MQRGRKSAASLSVIQVPRTGKRPKLTAPSSLTTTEKTTFDQLAAANEHLMPGDASLLSIFVSALSQMHRAAKRDDTKAWQQAAKLSLQAARSLRITPVSSVHPEKLSRQRRDAADDAAAAAQWLQNGGEPPWSEAEESRQYRAGDQMDDDDEPAVG